MPRRVSELRPSLGVLTRPEWSCDHTHRLWFCPRHPLPAQKPACQVSWPCGRCTRDTLAPEMAVAQSACAANVFPQDFVTKIHIFFKN